MSMELMEAVNTAVESAKRELDWADTTLQLVQHKPGLYVVVLSEKDWDPLDTPFWLVEESGAVRVQAAPTQEFEGLRTVWEQGDAALTAASRKATSIEIPGVDRDKLEERADLFAEQVVRLLGQTARKMSHQIGGVLIAAARDPLKAAAVSVDDIAGITDVWQDGTLSILMPAVQEMYTGSKREQAQHAAEALQTVTQPILEDETAVRYLTGARNRLVRVGDELWQHARTSLAEGLAGGESIPQLSQRVRDAASVTAPRATAIARTEVIGASNFGSISAMRALGVDGMMKTWIATDDARTRPSHRNVNGKEVKLDGTFIVGGWPADRPHDPMLPAEETVSCRCTLGYSILPEPPPLVPNQLSQAVAEGNMSSLQRVMNDLARRVSQKLPGGVTTEISRVVGAKNFGAVRFALRDTRGFEIGQVSRRFDVDAHDRLWVEHNYFEIQPLYQGRGIATTFNRELEELYRANGVQYIKLHADEDVGGYAWARAGYDWDQEKTTPWKVRDLLRETKFQDEAVSAQVDSMLEHFDQHDIETWPTPFDISQLGWKPGLDMWAGKATLLGSEWHGIKWLT